MALLNKNNEKKYLSIIRKVGKIYGYKDIQLSTNPKYKLMIVNNNKLIHFGSRKNSDFILYMLNGEKDKAMKMRNSYLKRTSKIKGDWKENDYSKNNLSRRIIWIEN
jgi:hypothetical protein